MIWGPHSGNYDEYHRLLGYNALNTRDVSEEHIVSIFVAKE
jgi:hypothetical protein